MITDLSVDDIWAWMNEYERMATLSTRKWDTNFIFKYWPMMTDHQRETVCSTQMIPSFFIVKEWYHLTLRAREDCLRRLKVDDIFIERMWKTFLTGERFAAAEYQVLTSPIIEDILYSGVPPPPGMDNVIGLLTIVLTHQTLTDDQLDRYWRFLHLINFQYQKIPESVIAKYWSTLDSTSMIMVIDNQVCSSSFWEKIWSELSVDIHIKVISKQVLDPVFIHKQFVNMTPDEKECCLDTQKFLDRLPRLYLAEYLSSLEEKIRVLASNALANLSKGELNVQDTF